MIKCEKPTIILNPHIKDIILKNKNYTLNGQTHWLSPHNISYWYDSFPYSKFSPKRLHIGQKSKMVDNVYQWVYDEDTCQYDIDNAFVFDITNGEPIPIYMVVGCGKCVICTEKKANEWATRAMCEAQTSTSHPYFITLTYNELNLPSDGVQKKHVQNFIKRFRINVERYTGISTNIRYYACSEYGSNYHRPHYHLLLYNLPLLQPNHVQDLVQKSWSYAISYETSQQLPSDVDKYGNPIYKYHDDDSNRWRKLLGYTHTKLANDGSTRYCMKYMHKENVIPDGNNKNFFLSSRRNGGLGSRWLNEHIEEYRDNYNYINVEFCDLWSGKNFTGILPRYFKDKIYPTIARLVPKEIRDKFKLWNYLSNVANSLIHFDYTPSPYVIANYPHLPYIRTSARNLDKYVDNNDYDNSTRKLYSRIDNLEQELLQFHYDIQLVDKLRALGRKRERYITDYIATIPQATTNVRAYNIRRRRRLAKINEIF